MLLESKGLFRLPKLIVLCLTDTNVLIHPHFPYIDLNELTHFVWVSIGRGLTHVCQHGINRSKFVELIFFFEIR